MSGDFARHYGIDEDGAVLVRPDGHVAFRARGGAATASASEQLVAALGRVLAR